MDRALQNLLVRVFGSFALAALLVHAGLDVVGRAMPALYLAPFFLGAVAANWALSRLNAKRAALWTAAILLGLVPATMPLAHLPRLGADPLYDGVVYAASAFGIVTGLLATWMLATRQPSAGG